MACMLLAWCGQPHGPPAFQLGVTGGLGRTPNFSCHLAHCSDQIWGGWGYRDQKVGTKRYSSFLERSHATALSAWAFQRWEVQHGSISSEIVGSRKRGSCKWEQG